MLVGGWRRRQQRRAGYGALAVGIAVGVGFGVRFGVGLALSGRVPFGRAGRSWDDCDTNPDAHQSAHQRTDGPVLGRIRTNRRTNRKPLGYLRPDRPIVGRRGQRFR